MIRALIKFWIVMILGVIPVGFLVCMGIQIYANSQEVDISDMPTPEKVCAEHHIADADCMDWIRKS